MYLTEDEFKVLLGLKERLSNKQIEEKYGVQMGMNDPRVFALAKKYGVDTCNPYFYRQIAEKADLSKVQIVSRAEMPYFEYCYYELADYVDIDKNDAEKIWSYFKDLPDDTPAQRLLKTEDGLGYCLRIKNLQTNQTTTIRIVADGEDCEV